MKGTFQTLQTQLEFNANSRKKKKGEQKKINTRLCAPILISTCLVFNCYNLLLLVNVLVKPPSSDRTKRNQLFDVNNVVCLVESRNYFYFG